MAILPARIPFVRIIIALLSLAVVAAALTILFLGMRSVMAIGGYCASGGPYVIAQKCPDGAWLIPVGIIVGLIAAFGYAMAAAALPGPRLWPLLWPALFLSLGWNFLEFGLNPPIGSGVAWGWLVCAIAFFVMGAAPLAFVLSRAGLRAVFWADAPSEVPVDPYRGVGYPARSRPASSPSQSGGRAIAAPRAGQAPDPASSEKSDDISEALERLTRLHDHGSLTDVEFTAAKQRLLEDG